MLKEKKYFFGYDKIWCYRKKRLEAVYTVEAAFVMGISFMALFVLTLLAFYLHDRQCLKAEMDRLVRRAAAESWNLERLEGEFGEGENCVLFFLEVREVKVMAEKEKTLEVSISFPAPPLLKSWLEKEEGIGLLSSNAVEHRPQDFIRKIEALR